MIGPIIVATDLSPASNLAVERGVELARRWECDLALLHVFRSECDVLPVP